MNVPGKNAPTPLPSTQRTRAEKRNHNNYHYPCFYHDLSTANLNITGPGFASRGLNGVELPAAMIYGRQYSSHLLLLH